MSPIPIPTAALSGLQRVLLVAALAPALLIVVVASIPAILVLPFLDDGVQRAKSLLGAHTKLVATLLRDSRA
jgi:hypothetical protein